MKRKIIGWTLLAILFIALVIFGCILNGIAVTAVMFFLLGVASVFCIVGIHLIMD